MQGKAISVMSKANNSEEYSLQRGLNVVKKSKEIGLYSDDTESAYKTYYTYEDFMYNKLTKYLRELQTFRIKIGELKESLGRDHIRPKFRKVTMRKNALRLLTRVRNRSKDNHRNLNTTIGYKGKESLGLMATNDKIEDNSIRKRKEYKNVRIHKKPEISKVRRCNNSSNQKREGPPSESQRIRLSTETSHFNRLRREDILLTKMIKRRKELRMMEQREHELLLKRGLNKILVDINSAKDLFLRSSVSISK